MVDRATKVLLALVALGLFANAFILAFPTAPAEATCYASDISDLADCLDDLESMISDVQSSASEAAMYASEAASSASNAEYYAYQCYLNQ